jgi:hypothetical protein
LLCGQIRIILNKMRQHLAPYLFAAIAIGFTACDTDEDPIDPSYAVPDTYSFERDGVSTVNFEGQTQRLDQLGLMEEYMKAANVIGAGSLSATTLRDMFANRNSPYVGRTFTKDIQSKCFAADTTMIIGLLDEIAMVSQNTGQEASAGVPGVLTTGSTTTGSGYLVNAKGTDLSEVILKSVMGACFYYQAMEVYLSADRMGTTGNDDLDTLGRYTLMEHYFDEAFGYLGLPIDYPSVLTTDEARHWGEYISSRNSDSLYTGIGEDLMESFRKGRAAISAKELADRDEAIAAIMQKWSVVAGTSAVDYLRKSKNSTGVVLYKRNHRLSEAIGFMLAMKYHFSGGNGKFAPLHNYTKIQDALGVIGLQTDLYTVTDTDIDNAIALIQAAYPAGTIK